VFYAILTVAKGLLTSHKWIKRRLRMLEHKIKVSKDEEQPKQQIE
jgi:hypothetical protein